MHKIAMIKEVELLKDYSKFVDSFKNDDGYIDPHITDEDSKNNLLTEKRDTRHSFIVFDGDEVIGAFILIVIPDELYIEMILGLSKCEKAYDELFKYIEDNYKSYDCDFVFNAKNYILINKLKNYNTIFETEQKKMVYSHKPLNISFDGIIPLEEKYYDDYINMHEKDTYWTADKVIDAKNRFNVFIALNNDRVIGYIDVTNCFNENEPYDIFVKEEYRNKGYGKKLLAKALFENKDNDMMLLVDTDNISAIKLYEKCGFIDCITPHYLTAHIKKI